MFLVLLVQLEVSMLCLDNIAPETRELALDDVTAIGTKIEGIFKDFPSIDSAIITAGVQKCFNLFDPATTTSEVVASEISTNLTATTTLVHYLAPHLLRLAQKGTKSNLFLTSSTLAYIPLSFYPTCCASKAGVAALAKVVRQQLSYIPVASDNMAVVEVVPPYTDTPLDKDHRAATIGMQGGADRAFAPMPLAEYIDRFFEGLDAAVVRDGSMKQEIGVVLGAVGVDT